MKKIVFMTLALVGVLFTSCSNDDIEILSSGELSISVDPSDLFSSYSFEDTQHGRNVYDQFRTFHSESDKYIEVKSLFYSKATDKLVSTIANYLDNTNTVTQSLSLPVGDYYVITILDFSDDNKGDSWWELEDEDQLSTAKLSPYSRFSRWSIMSMSTESVSITNGENTRLTVRPKPVGTLVYQYYQNFQYVSEDSYGVVGDNKVRRIILNSRTPGSSLNLDPRATNRFNYYSDGGSSTWYSADSHKPTDFDSSWTFFQSNLYGYCYIMEPQAELCFGYVLDGESSFHGSGQGTYTLEAGKTYLAYWDWFQVGNPYFGVATNSQWHTYTASTVYYAEPYYNWGASMTTVKSNLSARGYELYSESTNYLMYYGKNKEYAVDYRFNNNELYDINLYFDQSNATLTQLRSYVAQLGYGFIQESDGIYYYSNDDMSIVVGVYEYTYSDGSKDNVVEYLDLSRIPSARSRNGNLASYFGKNIRQK